MTSEEKTLLLSMISNGCEFRKGVAVVNDKEYMVEEINRVAALAETIFKKSIPQKPLDICTPVVKWGICPNCHGKKNMLGGKPNRCFESEKYCKDCGQKLDWSE